MPLRIVVVAVRVIVLAGAIGGLASCADATLPDGAHITCESNDGCPPGTTCATSLGRCVAVSGDRDAPALEGDPAPLPAAGAAGATFVLDLVTSERVGRPPDVVATVGRIALPPFELVSAGDDGRTFQFQYQAAGDEPEGIAAVEVVLVDESGNAADGIAAGTFVLDFAPPALVGGVRLNVAHARAETSIEARVAFGEPLAEPAAVTLVPLDAPGAPLVMNASGAEAFAYVVSGAEAPGRYAVRCAARDTAGNGVVIDDVEAVVTLDFEAPGPGGSALDATVLEPNDIFRLSVFFDEPVQHEIFDQDALVLIPTALAVLRGGDPQIDVMLIDTLFHPAENHVIFQHQVRCSDTQGTYDVTVSEVIDLAGNAALPMTNEGWDFTVGGEPCP